MDFREDSTVLCSGEFWVRRGHSLLQHTEKLQILTRFSVFQFDIRFRFTLLMMTTIPGSCTLRLARPAAVQS